jgi:hypothetical protein
LAGKAAVGPEMPEILIKTAFVRISACVMRAKHSYGAAEYAACTCRNCQRAKSDDITHLQNGKTKFVQINVRFEKIRAV